MHNDYIGKQKEKRKGLSLEFQALAFEKIGCGVWGSTDKLYTKLKRCILWGSD